MIFYDHKNYKRERFYEVRDLITHFTTISRNVYTPSENLSPDEIMTKFTGYDPEK